MSSLNGSYTATLSPTVASSETTATFPPHMLASSISSLSSSTSARHTSQISKTYRQASTLFLTRRLPEALSTILPLITPPSGQSENGAGEPAPVARASRSTRIKVWSLYLTTLNAIVELEPDEGKDAFGSQEWRALCTKVREGDIWEEVVRNGYHGVESDVDSDVVINLATLLLAHARTQELNQRKLESYLAAATSPNLDFSKRFSDSPSPSPRLNRHRSPAKATSGADTPRDLNARVKILELYTLHVLIRNNEWDYAREFISVSSVLDDERREAFLQALQSLQEEQQEAERRETEERREQEEQLRRDIEEAKKLRAENEERERRRLEEERARREGAEGDYGIEKTPSKAGSSKAGSSKGRHARAVSNTSGSNSNSKMPVSRAKGKSSAPPTLGTRASMVISRLREVIDQLGASFKTNPMLLMRLVAFILGLVVMFGQKNVRERIQRVLGNGWNKVKATAGMGVKSSRLLAFKQHIKFAHIPGDAGTKQVGPGAAEVYNLGAPVAVLFEARALEAVKGVRDALAAADDALVLVVSERAFVADADEGRGADVGVADGALAVALVAEAADGDAGLLAAHYEIAGGSSPEYLPWDRGAFSSFRAHRIPSRSAFFEIVAEKTATATVGSDIIMATVTEAPADTINSEPASSEMEVTQKRKASIGSLDAAEESSKRAKFDDGDHGDPPAQDSTQDSRPRDEDPRSSTARRAPLSRDEEKKRGKRLFGGLLSTLSQTNSSSQHKKRREIEQRQQERAQKQRAEDEKRRTEKLARITEARRKEQILFDEKVMKTRHANMLAKAQSLRTKAGPSIYYRPWKLTKEQEDEIDDQVQDAKNTIARELEAFKDRKEEHERRHGRIRPPTTAQEEPVPMVTEEQPAEAPPEVSAEAPAATDHAAASSDRDRHERDTHDEPGDVVENDEDMVIY
ncbi:peroxin 26 [Colletotrichum scovillei]|uniref:Peroxin 26 n=1 Tax=Colletotrichum scovillei TaxID=1209932 RepID=A0A9P7UIW9_9PEZI|nr:peroxin 26 [Colletotrichum scovillei]KAG7070073.1 peroxin 26 [Colletotrichum scovillei]KAG7078321.1 peroxin 26 [Colletotrichum scovillei]